LRKIQEIPLLKGNVVRFSAGVGRDYRVARLCGGAIVQYSMVSDINHAGPSVRLPAGWDFLQTISTPLSKVVTASQPSRMQKKQGGGFLAWGKLSHTHYVEFSHHLRFVVCSS